MRNFLVVLLLAHAVHYECATTYKCNETSPCGCAPVVPILAKILGGEPSVAQSWPWIVSLRQPASNKVKMRHTEKGIFNPCQHRLFILSCSFIIASWIE